MSAPQFDIVIVGAGACGLTEPDLARLDVRDVAVQLAVARSAGAL